MLSLFNTLIQRELMNRYIDCVEGETPKHIRLYIFLFA